MLSEDVRKRRRGLSRARSKVKKFAALARRAESRAAFWRRRVADIQFEQVAVYQPPLWPAGGCPRPAEELAGGRSSVDASTGEPCR